MDKLFTVHVNCTDVYEVKSAELTVRQILFDGSISGDIFNGVILPGGVDTQIEYPSGEGELRAKYTIKGTDNEGKECLMYIDNTAALGQTETRPVVYTDSEALSWINGISLKGKMRFEEEKILIDIFRDI